MASSSHPPLPGRVRALVAAVGVCGAAAHGGSQLRHSGLNVPRALVGARAKGMTFDVMRTSFFLSRRALRLAPKSEMPRWQERLFIWLARAANDASQYFGIPSGRAVEVGTQTTV